MADDFDKYDEPRLHMERLLKAHLVEFDLSLRILFPLEKAGIKTIGQLPNIGKAAINTIESFLSRYGLSLPQ